MKKRKTLKEIVAARTRKRTPKHGQTVKHVDKKKESKRNPPEEKDYE